MINVVSDTREITSSIKGFAILTVLINHYVNHYLSNNYYFYANGIVALFFITSGYGIFSALNKYNEISFSTISSFYYRRFVRIVPLFWVSIFLIFLIFKIKIDWKYFLFLSCLSSHQMYILPAHWFIFFIIQCYILSPILFLILKKIGIIKYVALNIIIILSIQFYYYFNHLSSNVYFEYFNNHFIYKYLYFGHILLFSTGMAIPNIIEMINIKFNNYLIIISFICFLLTVELTRFQKTGLFISSLFIINATFFCLTLINGTVNIFKNGFLIRIGKFSLSLYLFHQIYYQALERFDIITYKSIKSVVFTIALFPLFFLLCELSEKYINIFINLLQYYASRTLKRFRWFCLANF
jgi:peptidoglycan/LPS O-acetylase OafA/YrhL